MAHEEELDDYDDETCIVKFVYYKTTVGVAMKRLALMGFSLSRCQAYFEDELEKARRLTGGWLSEFLAEEHDEDDMTVREEERLRERLGQLHLLDFESWRETLRELVEGENFEDTTFMNIRPGDTIQRFSRFYGYHGEDSFPATIDKRIQLAVVLSTFDSEAPLVLDVSGLVESGQLGETEEVIGNGWFYRRHDIADGEPILILTEGSSDAKLLQQSLSALYPEVEDRFRFLDFGAANLAGGAPSLVAQVRAFVGAGVRIKILGIFDNDAAARDALRPLEKVKLPDNIGVMTLPELGFACNYPTVGPLGKLRGNVNGLAVSIEFFAGEDLLTRLGNGEPDPVIWGSYIAAARAYQGELSSKAAAAEALGQSLSMERDAKAHQLAHPELCLLWEKVFSLAESLK